MSQNPQTPQRVIPIETQQYAPYGTYVPPRVPGRPGILTAVGVVSIVLACLMVVSNCGAIFSVMIFTAASRAASAVLTVPPPGATPNGGSANASGQDPDAVKPRGLARRHELIVVAGLSAAHPLSPPRTKMLHRLLAQGGQDMFVMAPERLTPQVVKANVTESGQLPGVGNKLGNDYYIIGNGRIELADDHAVFAPSDGSEVIRVYEKAAAPNGDANDDDDESNASGTTPTPTTLPMIKPPTISDRAVMLSVLDAVLGCILAIYLFICGLFVLRDSMAARRMHIAWAVLKIPLAVLGAIATTMMMNDISAGTNGAAGGAQTVFGTVAIVLTILLGLIYPIALLIVLNTQTARGYYSPKE